MATTRIELVLFDLGGVLVDPGGVGPMRALAGIGSDEEASVALAELPLGVRLFEAGRCSPEEFAAGVVGDWVGRSPAAFLEAFGRARRPVSRRGGARRDGARRGPGRLPLQHQCVPAGHALRRSPHRQCLRVPLPLLRVLGNAKPDVEIFEEVASRPPVAPVEVLFLDDNAANVAGAEKIGFMARHRGIDEARLALAAAGVLES